MRRLLLIACVAAAVGGCGGAADSESPARTIAAVDREAMTPTTDGALVDPVRFCAFDQPTAKAFDRCFRRLHGRTRPIDASGARREFAAYRTDACGPYAGPLCAPYLRAERATDDDPSRFAAEFARQLRRAGL